MLTGQFPFRGEHEQAVTYQIVHGGAEPITAVRTGVPMELERIVNKCLEKSASDRYQDADELVSDLSNKEAPRPNSKKKVFKYTLPGAVIFVAIAVFFFLNPFQIEV